MGCGVAQTPELGIPFAAFSLFVNGVLLFRSLRRVGGKNANLPEDVVTEISRYGEGAWISFPMQLMEQIAYRADKPVLWGAHGYGFEALRQVFPVVRRDIASLRQVPPRAKRLPPHLPQS